MSEVAVCLCCAYFKTANIFAEMSFQWVRDLYDTMYMIRHDLIITYNQLGVSCRDLVPDSLYYFAYGRQNNMRCVFAITVQRSKKLAMPIRAQGYHVYSGPCVIAHVCAMLKSEIPLALPLPFRRHIVLCLIHHIIAHICAIYSSIALPFQRRFLLRLMVFGLLGETVQFLNVRFSA